MRAVLLLALVLSATAQAQGWHWVSPKPQAAAVNAVTFIGGTGWYVGAAGSIASTSDGAMTFQPRNSGVTADLYGVFFQSATLGWAVGDLGTILATRDGGQTWTRQASNSTRRIHGVWFTDALHGVAVGDFRTLLQTADGGQTWTGRATTVLSLDAVTFTDPLHGFICGEGGGILFTVDGGHTFTTVQTASSAHLLGLAFVDALHGFAVGEGGAVLATEDGGQTWVVQTVGSGLVDFVAVAATSTLQAYALGTNGALYATSDGNSWGALEQLDAVGLFTALVQEPVGGAWDATAQSGQWLRAAAGGIPPAVPVFSDINDLLPRSVAVTGVAFGSLDAGVMVASEYLYSTQDRGRHIAEVTPPADGGQAFGWNGVSMPDGTNAYAVGIRGTLAVSHDQGQTWATVATGTTEDLEAIEMFPDSGTGYAVGSTGVVLVTANGGESWRTLSAVTSATLTSLAFADAQHGVVGGQYGELLTTLNGTDFQFSPGVFFGTVTGLAYPAPGVALACATDGTLARSTNQGQAFYPLLGVPVSQSFGALSFASRLNGWLGGDTATGGIWVTSDGAQSFALQFSGSTTVTGFSFVDPTHGYAVGAGGMLLATDSAGGPACAADADCVDAGQTGITCTAGSCLPCTTDDRCGPTCAACPAASPYCYGSYCGTCENDAQCPGGFCELGACQESPASDGGGVGAGTTGSASSTGTTGTTGGVSGTTGGGSTSGGSQTGGTTVACAAGSGDCSGSPGCGCGTVRGGAVWTVLLAALLALHRRRRAAP